MIEEYYSKHSNSLMDHEGDVKYSRKYYYEKKPSNLFFLLKKRSTWINKFINKKSRVLEVGCGIGVTKDFILKKCEYLSTDIYDHEWVDRVVDAMNTPFKDNSFDVVFCSNMIHHLPYPQKFFSEIKRILKPNGYLLIQEVNCSFFLKLILKLMNHEGWSYNQDIFSSKKATYDEEDIWKGNNAIPNLLFDDKKRFQEKTGLRIKSNNYEEFLIFILSGGVTAKTKTINLPYFLLVIIDKIDNLLTAIAPSIFALQRKVVIKNEK